MPFRALFLVWNVIDHYRQPQIFHLHIILITWPSLNLFMLCNFACFFFMNLLIYFFKIYVSKTISYYRFDGSAVAQWYSASLETEGLQVWASLHCGPWARHIYLSLVRVQPRKTRPCLTERSLMGPKESNKQTYYRIVYTCKLNDSLYLKKMKPVKCTYKFISFNWGCETRRNTLLRIKSEQHLEVFINTVKPV